MLLGKETTIFTKEMSMMEALQADPRAKDVFASYGIDCMGCMGVGVESIEDGAKMYGVDPDELVADLNKLQSRPQPTE